MLRRCPVFTRAARPYPNPSSFRFALSPRVMRLNTASFARPYPEASFRMFGMEHERATASRLVYNERAIEKSDNDNRKYGLIQLDNRLTVLLVSDPYTDMASAAMDVRTGSLFDPPHVQGLAHFLEHMLFLGTEKYPRENEYAEYLAKHGGHANAYTGLENTNYYFSVDANALEGALDRFAQFFISPRFDSDCTDREINAVDSEHKKNLQSDPWRAYQIEKALANPQHEYSKFSTGNAVTLRDIPVRDGTDLRKELLAFHERYYSANIMQLVILGKESLDDLTKWTVEKFSNVKNFNVDPPVAQGHPYGPNEYKRLVKIKPVKDKRDLEVTWAFPDQSELFETHPEKYVSHLLGHEGKGSLLSLLKKEGLANGLSAGAGAGATGFDFFKVHIELTEQGLEQHERVLSRLFQYIDMMRSNGPQLRIFEEARDLASIKFRFKEKSDVSSYASHLAHQMQQPYPPEWILSAPHLLRKFDPEILGYTMSLLDKERFWVTLSAKSIELQEPRKEEWYNAEYSVEALPTRLVDVVDSHSTTEDFFLPHPNPFIPEDFTLKGAQHAVDEKRRAVPPVKVHEDTQSSVWLKVDDTFAVPKLHVSALVRTPFAYATPRFAALSLLHCGLIRDALVEEAYDAEVAGSKYHISSETEGIVVSVEGFHHKHDKLFEKILRHLASFDAQRPQFDRVKDKITRSLANFSQEAPYRHALYSLSLLTQERLWTQQEMLDQVKQIQYDEVSNFVRLLHSSHWYDVLVHGNATHNDALRIKQMVQDTFHASPLVPQLRVHPRSVLLPAGSKHHYVQRVPNGSNPNSAIEFILQVCHPTDVHLRALLHLYVQVIHEPCFDQLRTKEQLGYMVFSGVRRQPGSYSLRIIVQSEKPPGYLESRIEHFLARMTQEIEEMTQEDFETHISAVKTQKLESDKSLFQESRRHLQHILSGFHDFQEEYEDVDALERLTKQDLVGFVQKHIDVASLHRKKLSVHMLSQQVDETTSLTTEDVLVKDITQFKAMMTMSGAPMPVSSRL